MDKYLEIADTIKESPFDTYTYQIYLMISKDIHKHYLKITPPTRNPLYIKPKRTKRKRMMLSVYVKKSLPKLLLLYAKSLDAKI